MFKDFDIVITTYEILRGEVHFIEDHRMKLRDRGDNSKKKGIPKSPLIKGKMQYNKTQLQVTTRFPCYLVTVFYFHHLQLQFGGGGSA
jgi:hypothetical protein